MADFSQLTIANRAIGKLGIGRPIASLSEGTVAARAILRVYDDILERLLEEIAPKFATDREELAADATAPTHGRARSFSLPARCRRLLPPYPELDFNRRDWLIEGRKIYTNDSAPLNVRFVQLITNPNTMTALFREALASAIAVDICEQLTNSTSKKQELKDQLEKDKANCRIVDAAEQPPTEETSDDWTDQVL